MNALPDFVICGEWPDAFGNYATMAWHNRKRWALTPTEEIKVWRDWFAAGPGKFWETVDDIEAELARDEQEPA